MRVLVLDLQCHDRAALVQLYLLDLADRHARDVDRLALAGGNRLGGAELALQLEEVGAQQGYPARKVEALVSQDVAGDREREQRQRDDRDEVAHVLLDRVPHGFPPAPRRIWSPAPAFEAGPLRSGFVFL